MDEKYETKRVAERIQLVANVCVIVAALALIFSIGWLFLRHSSLSRARGSSIQNGTKLTLPNLDWSRSRQTLLLVLSTSCKYCTASAPFYRRLVNQTSLTDTTRLIAVFPQPIKESEEYLGKNDIKINDLRQAWPASLGATGTPTLILVNSDGAVIQSWKGTVPPQAEDEILAAMK